MFQFNYKIRENKWNLYRKTEKKAKEYFLKRLSIKDGYNILKDLSQIAYKLHPFQKTHKFTLAKTNELIRIHRIMGKVAK